MNGYWALVHEDEGAFGISFPDVLGCVSSGSTVEEVLSEGREALSAHLALMKADHDPLPRPRSLTALKADPDALELAEGAAWHLVVPRPVQAPRMRVNVMIEPGLLHDADEAAEAAGLTRSALIEAALKDRLARDLRRAGKA